MSGCGATGQHRRWYKNWRILVPLALLLVFLYIYLVTALTILYNFLWWPVYHEGTFLSAVPGKAPQSAEPVVPKLLHQTWKDDQLPEMWKMAQKSCVDLHPEYQYKLWTDQDAEQLIASKFPWFLSTFKSYPHGIQRADALRYFVLYEHGGIYLDLDVVCNKNLDYLLHYEFVTPKTFPIGVSNDVIVSKPKSDFALRLIRNLASWNKFLFVKYVTVMFSTGPMFVTIQYALYAHKERLAIIPVELYGKYKITADAMFKHLHGSSWHGSDGKYFLWISRNALLFGGTLLLLAFLVIGYFVFHRRRAIYRHANRGLGGLAGGSGAAADGVKESGWEKTLGLTSVEREKEQRKRKSMPMV